LKELGQHSQNESYFHIQHLHITQDESSQEQPLIKSVSVAAFRNLTTICLDHVDVRLPHTPKYSQAVGLRYIPT